MFQFDKYKVSVQSYYVNINVNEYNIVRDDTVLPLQYKDQELIIQFLKERYDVIESLDHRSLVENTAIVGFNKMYYWSSCWINIYLASRRNPTLKYPKGRIKFISEKKIVISRLEDEYYHVHAKEHTNGVSSYKLVRCDQIDGLIKFLKDFLDK